MRTLSRASVLFALAVLLAVGPGSRLAAQELTDLVIVGVYVNLKPQSAGEWVMLFKKHFVPALEELKTQGDLVGYRLLIPGVHHPAYTYTHLLALAIKDRAAQGRVEKKLREVFAKMPAPEGQTFQGAGDPSKHFDDEWREVDLAKVTVPEEKKPEEKKPEEKKAEEKKEPK